MSSILANLLVGCVSGLDSDGIDTPSTLFSKHLFSINEVTKLDVECLLDTLSYKSQ
jgi:hypothetical protein